MVALLCFEKRCLILFLLLLDSWEKTWRPIWMFDFFYDHYWFPVACVALYLAGIYYGQIYFETRPAWNVKGALAAWNLCLALFSALGFTRCFPYVVHNISTYGFEATLCMDPEQSMGQSATVVWVMMFLLAKIPYVQEIKKGESLEFFVVHSFLCRLHDIFFGQGII